MYKLIKKNGNARRGEFVTVHGTVQTPAFMNVATQGAIKGGVSAYDLKDIDCQVQLCNTYHLHLRPTDTLVKEMGGLHKFQEVEPEVEASKENLYYILVDLLLGSLLALVYTNDIFVSFLQIHILLYNDQSGIKTQNL